MIELTSEEDKLRLRIKDLEEQLRKKTYENNLLNMEIHILRNDLKSIKDKDTYEITIDQNTHVEVMKNDRYFDRFR